MPLNANRQGDEYELTKKEQLVQTLLTKKPADVEAFIDANVTDLASAKQILKIYGKVLLLLTHKVLNGE